MFHHLHYFVFRSCFFVLPHKKQLKCVAMLMMNSGIHKQGINYQSRLYSAEMPIVSGPVCNECKFNRVRLLSLLAMLCKEGAFATKQQVLVSLSLPLSLP